MRSMLRTKRRKRRRTLTWTTPELSLASPTNDAQSELQLHPLSIINIIPRAKITDYILRRIRRHRTTANDHKDAVYTKTANIITHKAALPTTVRTQRNLPLTAAHIHTRVHTTQTCHNQRSSRRRVITYDPSTTRRIWPSPHTICQSRPTKYQYLTK